MRGLPFILLAACAASARPPAAPPLAGPAAGDEDLVSAMAPLMPAGAMKDFDWTPEVAASPAEKVFTNVRVLGQLRADRFMTGMLAMKGSLGVACDHCHDPKRYPSDEKGAKMTARRMMLLARDVNDQGFGGQTRVTCWTCHRGEVKPPSAPDGFPELIAARPAHPALAVPEGMADKPARKVWKNLQILGGRQAPALAPMMNAFTIALGVDCKHCHDERDWASDVKPAKQRTREMLRLVGRTAVLAAPRGEVSCFTCHRGKIDVPRVP